MQCMARCKVQRYLFSTTRRTSQGPRKSFSAVWIRAAVAPRPVSVYCPLSHCGLCLNPDRRRFGKVPPAQGGGHFFGKTIKSSIIIDGDLVWQYLNLARARQAAVAAAAGTTHEEIMQHVRNLAAALTLF